MSWIADAVQSELGRFGPAAGMARIVSAWPEAVGPAVARNAWPSRIARDGTLHVTTSSSSWAFELGQLEPTVREQLAAALDGDAPPKLRFAPGRLPEPDLPPEQAVSGRRPTPGPEERELAASLAAAVEDDRLRELVSRAAAASLARPRDDRPV